MDQISIANLIHCFTISVPIRILPFFGSCCEETEKVRVNLCFETNEHSVQTTNVSWLIGTAWAVLQYEHAAELFKHSAELVLKQALTQVFC